MNIQIIEMVVVNSICCLLSAIIDNTFYQLFVLVFSSAPKSGIAVAQYFYLLSLTSVLMRKPKQTMVDRHSVAKFYTIFKNGSIYLFIQLWEFKQRFSRFVHRFQWPNTWFPSVSIPQYQIITHIHGQGVH